MQSFLVPIELRESDRRNQRFCITTVQKTCAESSRGVELERLGKNHKRNLGSARLTVIIARCYFLRQIHAADQIGNPSTDVQVGVTKGEAIVRGQTRMCLPWRVQWRRGG